MPAVIGNPILKGNSQVVIACRLSTTSPVDKVLQGAFVSRLGATPIEPIVGNLEEGGLFGIALELPRCNNNALTVVTKAESVLVRTDGTAPPNGTKILIDTSGFISATGTWTANGYVLSELVSGYDRDGTLQADCVWVSLNSVEFAGGAPVAASAKSSNKLTDKG